MKINNYKEEDDDFYFLGQGIINESDMEKRINRYLDKAGLVMTDPKIKQQKYFEQKKPTILKKIQSFGLKLNKSSLWSKRKYSQNIEDDIPLNKISSEEEGVKFMMKSKSCAKGLSINKFEIKLSIDQDLIDSSLNNNNDQNLNLLVQKERNLDTLYINESSSFSSNTESTKVSSYNSVSKIQQYQYSINEVAEEEQQNQSPDTYQKGNRNKFTNNQPLSDKKQPKQLNLFNLIKLDISPDDDKCNNKQINSPLQQQLQQQQINK